jgi:predicted ATPase
MEAPLVAEGLRKFAMLARLISTGVLLEQGYLFWDEPETNLNPQLIRILAEVIGKIAEGGVQVFIATHSLFLLKEIEILTAQKKLTGQPRYFAIAAAESGEISELEQGDTLTDLNTLVLLDEELKQADRFREADA